MEESIFWLTWLFLGDYYKTYGSGSKSVQGFVEAGLDDPKQFINSPSWNASAPFIVEDETYNYVTGAVSAGCVDAGEEGRGDGRRGDVKVM